MCWWSLFARLSGLYVAEVTRPYSPKVVSKPPLKAPQSVAKVRKGAIVYCEIRFIPLSDGALEP